MPLIEFDTVTGPVSPDDHCGPDLDLEGDADYLNFLAGTEGRLPSSYFAGKDESGAVGRPFQFGRDEVDAIVAAAQPLLAKTRDLRLLVLVSKVCLLGRELGDFITAMRAIAALLHDRWDEVHPRAEDGEFAARMVAVESIDVQPTVIMPLQFVPLIEHRRLGTISYRGQQLSSGAIAPRENEEVIDAATVEKIIREADLDAIIGKRAEFTALRAALDAIRATWSERSPGGAAPELGKVLEVATRIERFLDDAVKLRDPAAAMVADGSGGQAATTDAEAATAGVAGPVGRVTNPGEAAAALTAVADYFSRQEPSSPTLLLVRQANQLLGKSFLEVMRALVPTHVEVAAINIGRTESFTLPIERLSALQGDGNGTEPAFTPAEESATRFVIGSRAEALALLDQVGAYFRAAEPSSPIPFLIERARDLAQRDFLSVLKALLPADTLKPNNN